MDKSNNAPVAIPAGYALVPVKISDEMIEAAMESHYGKRRTRQNGGAAGIVMTVNGHDWNGVDAMRRFWKGAISAAPPPPAPASAIPEIDPPQSGGNKGKLPALARTREGWNLYTLGYNRGLKKGRDEVAPASASVGMTEEQREDVDVAIQVLRQVEAGDGTFVGQCANAISGLEELIKGDEHE